MSTDGKTLKELEKEVGELETRRRVCVRELADCEWKLSQAAPSQRGDIRAELEMMQGELSKLNVDLKALRLEYQRVDATVRGLRLAQTNLRAHLRQFGWFDQMVTVKAEALRALPGGAALLEAEYKAALENKEKAKAQVEQLEADIAALEG